MSITSETDLLGGRQGIDPRYPYSSAAGAHEFCAAVNMRIAPTTSSCSAGRI